MRSWPALEIASPVSLPAERWDLVQAALTDLDITAIDDNAPNLWRVFFRTWDARSQAADALRGQFPELGIAPIDVPDDDWAARSQASVTAIQIGNIIVAPPWDVGRTTLLAAPKRSEGGATTITIIIQPSMGFGTGHHPTTRLCLAHLQAIELRNQTVLDVGTGSGVLAIAASRLGALRVLGIDDDEDAIRSARENIDMNPGADVTLGMIDFRSAMLRPFDLVIANLTGAMLASFAGALLARAAPRGRLILSGFIAHEERNIQNAFASCTIVRRSQEDEWVCVTLQR